MNPSKSQTRINQQIRNMLKENLTYLKAAPLQNDIYTWHFTIQGPQNSDFHQGLYHGQILLPFEYPFKPPDMIFMNKNGRFQVNTKICLTITQYHPQDWNPSWTIRTMLEAVISLFNERVMGIGYQQGSKQMRQSLALKSHNFKCDKCGVLKDLLKPRQPIKQQQITEINKSNDAKAEIYNKPIDFMIPQMLRKIKTQDNPKVSVNTANLPIQNQTQQKKQKKQQKKFNQGAFKKGKQKQKLFKQKKIQNNLKQMNQQSFNMQFKFSQSQNDSITLDKKISKNYYSMLKAFKSVKVTLME